MVAIRLENSSGPFPPAEETTLSPARADSSNGTVSSSVPIEERWTLVDGHRMRYLHGGSGPPLLLIHGLLGYSYSWRYNLAALAQHVSVYAVDLLGTGFSERPPKLDCSVAAIARRMVTFLDAVGLETADVLGTSHGGGVAIMLAATVPQRVHRLILSAPVNPWSSHGRFRTWILSSALGAWTLRRMFRFLRPVHKRFLRQMYGDARRMLPGACAGYSKAINVPGTLDYLIRIIDGWRNDLRELEQALPRIAHIPTLLLWGSRDRVVYPHSAERLRRNFTDCRLVIFEGAGHLPYEEVPEDFNRALLDFLQTTSTNTRSEPGQAS